MQPHVQSPPISKQEEKQDESESLSMHCLKGYSCNTLRGAQLRFIFHTLGHRCV